MINLWTNEIESFTFLRWKINNANHMKTSCEFSMIMQKKETGRNKNSEKIIFFGVFMGKEKNQFRVSLDKRKEIRVL